MRIGTRIYAILIALCLRLALTSSIEYPELAFVKSVTQNEDTKTAIDRLSSVSRIITAVSILRGLSDASVPADAVISELLNLGSINLASLENFDKTKVDEFIDKLKSTNMAGDGKVGKGIIDLKTIKESWITWTKASKLPDNAAYTELAKLKSLDVEGLKSKIPNVVTSNKKLKQFSSLTDQDVVSLKSSLKSVTGALSSVKGNTNLKKTVDLLKQWDKLSAMVHIFQLYDDLPSFKYTTDDAKKDFISNINALKNLQSLESGPIFEAINSIISSRFIFHPTDRQQTSGFVNGFEDISKLENDVKDEWVTNLFAAFQNLDKVLTLATLNAPMVSLDKKWKSSATQSIYTSMKKVDSLRSLLVTLSTIPSENELKSGLSTLEQCFLTSVVPALTKPLISSINSVGTLSSRIIAFNDIDTLSQQNKVADIIDKLSKDTKPDDVQKLEEFFASLELKLQILTDGGKIIDEVDKIQLSAPTVTNFEKDKLILEYKRSFECFAKADFEKLVTPVRITTQVRNIKSTKVLDDVKAAAAAVADTSENLKQVRQSVSEVARKEESKALEDMDGLKKYSKPFGDAVNVLVSMTMASTKGKEFETMLLKGSLVEGAVGAAKNTEVEAKFRKDWGNFAETVSQVSKLFGAIREWQNGLSISKDVNFESMDTLFSNLAGLTDVNLQTEKRLAAVESDNVNVIPNIKTLREDFIKDLLVVSKLDLQFSRFKSAVADMPETMKHVSGVLNNGGNSTSVENNSQAAGWGLPEWGSMSAGIAFLGVCILLSVLYCFNCCGMKTAIDNLFKKKPKKKDDGGSGDDGIEKGGQPSRSTSKTGTTKTATPSSSNTSNAGGRPSRSSSAAGTSRTATPSSSNTSNAGVGASRSSSGTGSSVPASRSSSGISNDGNADREEQQAQQRGGPPSVSDIVRNMGVEGCKEFLRVHDNRNRSTVSGSTSASTTQGTSTSVSTGQPPSDAPLPHRVPTWHNEFDRDQCQDPNVDKTMDNVDFTFEDHVKKPK